MNPETLLWARKNLLTTVFSTSKIEIPAITMAETERILSAIDTTNSTHAQIVTNIKRAWEFCLDTNPDYIDLPLIRTIHGHLGSGLIPGAGALRDHPVRITGTDYTPRGLVCVEDVTRDLDRVYSGPDSPADRAARWFAVMCKAQWFPDGNKRTAAIIAGLSLLQSGTGFFRIPPEAVETGVFQDRLIRYYEDDDLGAFSAWLTDNAVIDFTP